MSELKDYIVASIKKDLDALKSKGWVTQQSYDTIVAELTKSGVPGGPINQTPTIGVSTAGIPGSGSILPDQVNIDPKQAYNLGNKGYKAATKERAKALYDFPGDQRGDLAFKTGDVIDIISKDGDWWTGSLNGKTGSVPATYVQLLPTDMAKMEGGLSKIIQQQQLQQQRR